MKAIEALKQINDIFPNYISMAKDNNGVYVYDTEDLIVKEGIWTFEDTRQDYEIDFRKVSDDFASKIEWDLHDWTKCIVTINDFKDEM